MTTSVRSATRYAAGAGCESVNALLESATNKQEPRRAIDVLSLGVCQHEVVSCKGLLLQMFSETPSSTHFVSAAGSAPQW